MPESQTPKVPSEDEVRERAYQICLASVDARTAKILRIGLGQGVNWSKP